MGNFIAKISQGRLRIIYGAVLFIIDLIFLSLASFLAYYIRFYTKIFTVLEFYHVVNSTYFYFSLIFISLFIVVSAMFMLYSWRSIYSKPTYYLRIFIAVLISVMIMAALWLIFVNFLFSRIWLLMLFLLSLVFLIIGRSLTAIITRKCLQSSGIKTDFYFFGIGENLKLFKTFSRLKKKIIYGFLLMVNDIIFFGFSFYYAYYLRFYTTLFHENELSFTINNSYVFYSVIFICSAVFIFYINKLYNWDQIYRGSGYSMRIAKSVIINIVIIILIGFLYRKFTFSRIWIALLTIFCLITLIISRLLLEVITQVILRKIGISSKTAIIGIGENGRRIEDTFNRRSFWGFNVVGYIDHKNKIQKNRDYSKSFKILGHTENIVEVIKNNNIQRVIISGLEYKYFEILEIIEQLKGMDVSIMLFPGFFEFSIKRMDMREISGIPLMQVANIGFFGINLFLKNLIDYVLGTIIFILFIPIYLLVGLMIKIDSPGPVFYKQKRYTKKCKEFYIYKFRTMFIDADERLEELKHLNEADGPLFKIKNDPRITNVGRFLRKYSIDEIPQIINVLRGELSIVGPRPPIPSEVEQYNEWEMKRLDVKQGITGLWQISGRSELNFEEMTRLDLYYIQNWSIFMDIMIILKTLPAAISSKGAY
ncbi:MAG: exopolysaccharide biosynthesis polyprenyl glycosylphosphotransferase [Actinomycetota bacterium]|nr:exopolysaccharide biosynthesis polyprenyl glycosylphosphotransferase [Actinomycetota bacterium]